MGGWGGTSPSVCVLFVCLIVFWWFDCGSLFLEGFFIFISVLPSFCFLFFIFIFWFCLSLSCSISPLSFLLPLSISLVSLPFSACLSICLSVSVYLCPSLSSVSLPHFFLLPLSVHPILSLFSPSSGEGGRERRERGRDGEWAKG